MSLTMLLISSKHPAKLLQLFKSQQKKHFSEKLLFFSELQWFPVKSKKLMWHSTQLCESVSSAVSIVDTCLHTLFNKVNKMSKIVHNAFRHMVCPPESWADSLQTPWGSSAESYPQNGDFVWALNLLPVLTFQPWRKPCMSLTLLKHLGPTESKQLQKCYSNFFENTECIFTCFHNVDVKWQQSWSVITIIIVSKIIVIISLIIMQHD